MKENSGIGAWSAKHPDAARNAVESADPAQMGVTAELVAGTAKTHNAVVAAGGLHATVYGDLSQPHAA